MKRTLVILSVFLLLVPATIFIAIHFQARAIVLALVERESEGKLTLEIGGLNIHYLDRTIELSGVHMLPANGNIKRIRAKSICLAPGSLWNFLLRKEITIEQLRIAGGHVHIIREKQHTQSAPQESQFSRDLGILFGHLEKGAIDFQIDEIDLTDCSFTIEEPDFTNLIQGGTFHASKLHVARDSLLSGTASVAFSLPKQKYFLSPHSYLSFDSLSFNSETKHIQIDSFKFVDQSIDSSTHTTIISDRLRIAKLDHIAFLTKGEINVDSLFVGTSYVDIAARQQRRSNTFSLTSLQLPFMYVRHIIADGLKGDVSLTASNRETQFSFQDSRLHVDDLRHHPDSTRILTSSHFRLELTRYQNLINNRTGAIRFDTIVVESEKITLKNFIYQKTEMIEPVLSVPSFELINFRLYDLLFNNRVIATAARAVDPIIYLAIQKSTTYATNDSSLVLDKLRELIEVDKFIVSDGTVTLIVPNEQTRLAINGMHLKVPMTALENIRSLEELLPLIEDFRLRNLRTWSNGVESSVTELTFDGTSLHTKSLLITDDTTLHVELLNCSFQSIHHNGSNYIISGLTWENGSLRRSHSMRTNTQGTSGKEESFLSNIRLQHLKGGRIDLNISNPSNTIKGQLNFLHAEQITGLTSPEIDNPTAGATDLIFTSPTVTLTVDSLRILNHECSLMGIHLNQIQKDSLLVSIDKLTATTDWSKLLQGELHLRETGIKGSRVEYSKSDSLSRMKLNFTSSLSLKEVTFNNNSLQIKKLDQVVDNYELLISRYQPPASTALTQPEVRTTFSSRLKNRIRAMADSMLLDIRSVDSLANPQSDADVIASSNPWIHTHMFTDQYGGITLSASELDLNTERTSLALAVCVNDVRLRKIKLTRKDLAVDIHSGTGSGLRYTTHSIKDLTTFFLTNESTGSISDLSLSITTPNSLFTLHQGSYYPALQLLSFKRFAYSPSLDESAYHSKKRYQSDHIRLATGDVMFSGIDLNRYLRDSIIHIRSIQVSSPEVKVHRDKILPELPGNIKLLPTNAFREIPFRFILDTLRLLDGKVTYTERSRTTMEEGVVLFTHLNARLRNVKNTSLSPADSLTLSATARFLDSARVSHRMRESYHDSLAGFILVTQVSPFHTSILNPILEPLASVRFQSGFIDTLYMAGIGREYLSFGRMKFFYKGLKVDIRNPYDTGRHTLGTQIMQFAANNFVIRSRNTRRTGQVYYERHRDKAIFNYWVKMILSGVITSTGTKTNKSLTKEYERSLLRLKLPPINKDIIKED